MKPKIALVFPGQGPQQPELIDRISSYSTYSQRFSPYTIFAGSQDQGFQRSINQFNSVYDFEQVISGDYGHLVSGDDGESIWTVYPGFAMYYPNASTNSSGITWDFQMSGNLWLPPLMEDPYDPSSVYIAGGGLSVSRIARTSSNPKEDLIELIRSMTSTSSGIS